MSLTITFIGAGSLVFARTLFTDIMSVPELQKAEISFTDINPDNLEKTRELCQRDLDANGIPVVIEATTDRRAALKDARYIVNCVRVGGLEGFETDKIRSGSVCWRYIVYWWYYVRTTSNRGNAGFL